MSCSVPLVVAKQSFLSQTASLSATTIYTPDADSDFLVAVGFGHTIPGSGGVNIQPTVSWTDEFGPQSGIISTTPNPLVIHALSGDPIQLSVSFSEFGGATGQSFDAYATVIKI